MNANLGIGFDPWMIIIASGIIGVGLVVTFVAGYLAGSAKTKRTMENPVWKKKIYQHKRIIRMQAAPKPKKPNRAVGYYPATKARREQAKYRRAEKRQIQNRGK
ncbi:hypothetical protein IKE80_00250 [Candidatus Saccharibacteria bacterium]|nr:hypothetical protein [Candidatus Saccharibacteria bacterium]